MTISSSLSDGSSFVLNFIRTIAAQLVVVGHGFIFFNLFPVLRHPSYPLMEKLAVLVFFIASGFLITFSVFKKKSEDPSYSFKFYFIDRFSRIYSAFIPALIFVFLLDYISIYIAPNNYAYKGAFDFITFIGNVFMLQDFPQWSIIPELVTSFGSARPFWTLAIEWWIYLLFGFVVLKLSKEKSIKLTDLAILVILGIVPAYNLIRGRGNCLTLFWIYGSLMYLIYRQDLLKNINKKIKILLILGFLFLAWKRIFLTMEEYEPVIGFIVAAIVFLLIDLFKTIHVIENIKRLFAFTADYSYTLYLIHFSVLDFLVTHYSKKYNVLTVLCIGIVISNIISITMAHFTEIWLTRKVKNTLYDYFRKAPMKP